jgi:hypothetical protein
VKVGDRIVCAEVVPPGCAAEGKVLVGKWYLLDLGHIVDETGQSRYVSLSACAHLKRESWTIRVVSQEDALNNLVGNPLKPTEVTV